MGWSERGARRRVDIMEGKDDWGRLEEMGKAGRWLEGC